MHRAILGLLVAALVALGAALVPAGWALAQDDRPAATWSVLPGTAEGPDTSRSRFVYDAVEPGASRFDHVVVRNLGEGALSLLVYASDAVNTPSGGFDLLPADGASRDVGEWVRVPAPSVTLNPGEMAVVPFTIVVPPNATPGDHAGGIVAALVATTTDASGANVDVHYRVGARIYLRVAGELDPRLVIENFQARYEDSFNPLDLGDLHLSYTVRNAGNVRLSGTQALGVAGPFGLTVDEEQLEALPEMLPGTALDLTHVARNVLPVFHLDAELTVQPVAPTGTASLTLDPVLATASTWAVPWVHLAILVALAIALVIRWRRRRAVAAAPPIATPVPDPTPAHAQETKG
jgi:hypothetical protein